MDKREAMKRELPGLIESGALIPCYHNRGEGACMGIAWYWVREPKEGDAIAADAIIYPDGTPAQPDEVIQCKACGMAVGVWIGGCGR